MLFQSTLYALFKLFTEKWCLYKSVGKVENGLEPDFVKHGLNPV